MSNAIDQLFAGMAKAPINGGGTYMSEGLYVVEISSISTKTGFTGSSFIAEFRIVESNNPAHAVGVTRSRVLKFDAAKKEKTFADISLLVMALLGKNPQNKENQTNETIREQAAKYARAVCGSDSAKAELGAEYEEGMFTGARLRLECTDIATKGTPTSPSHPFTVHAWSPIAA